MQFKLVESSEFSRPFFSPANSSALHVLGFTGPRNSGPEITDVTVKADVQIDGAEK